MLSYLTYIVWDPIAEVIPGWSVPRWYGLLFALGFLVSQQLLTYIFKKEGKSEKDVEILTIYIVIATIVGARLGHVLFYDAKEYFSNPLEILKIWHGGLASHGAAIGILLSLFLYVKKKKGTQTYLWVVDRLVIAVAITGCLIRFGNFMNSEIIGKPTESRFGVVFAREVEVGLENFDQIANVEVSKRPGELLDGNVPIEIAIEFNRVDWIERPDVWIKNTIKPVLVSMSNASEVHIYEPTDRELEFELDKRNNIFYAKIASYGVARHPAQLYESLYCLLLFLLLFFIWNKWKEKTPDGLIFGLFLVILWSLRFADEFFKENQVEFEDQLPLNMGQILSIPLILFGIFMLIRTWRKTKKVQDQSIDG